MIAFGDAGLSAWLEQYLTEHDLSRSSCATYRCAVNQYLRFDPGSSVRGMGQRLSEFVQVRSEVGSRRTAACYRRVLLTLLRAGEQAGIAEVPTVVRRVRLPQLRPRALTLDEIRRLLDATERQPHGRTQRAAILLTYDSAFRRGDVFRAAWSDVGPDDVIRLVISKTGRLECRQLRPATIDACREVTNGSGRLVPWNWNWSSWHKAWRKLARDAGLSEVAESGLQMIRRSAASYLKRDGFDPAAILGHSAKSGRLADEFYIDRRIADSLPPLPPPIEQP